MALTFLKLWPVSIVPFKLPFFCWGVGGWEGVAAWLKDALLTLFIACVDVSSGFGFPNLILVIKKARSIQCMTREQKDPQTNRTTFFSIFVHSQYLDEIATHLLWEFIKPKGYFKETFLTKQKLFLF